MCNECLATKNAVDSANFHLPYELNLIPTEIRTCFFIMCYIMAQGLCLLLAEQQVCFINVTIKAVYIAASERKVINNPFKSLMK